MIKIVNVVGARPNFVKIAPILEAMNKAAGVINPLLVHTGQHYDYEMDRAFFEDLSIPDADISLGVGSGSHAQQTAAIMIAFEKYCLAEQPDLVLVVGDVNSTIACTLAAKKLVIPVAHVEAGLRSGDMSMPEEVNRRCTDAITDILFATEPSGVENLLREGHKERNVHLVGNVMIDTLFKHREAAAALAISDRLELTRGNYGVVTLHRPSNTDDPTILGDLLHTLIELSQRLPFVFPMHPRTRASIDNFGFSSLVEGSAAKDLRVVEPLRYLEFISLLQSARIVVTDSGGLQEETTALGIPCLTMRDNTERPITCEQGTNRLIGQKASNLRSRVLDELQKTPPKKPRIEYWDGHAADRIVARLLSWSGPDRCAALNRAVAPV